MPSSTSVSNSFLATWSFSGERRLACECTGKPVVGMRCRTPCLGDAFENVGVVKAGRLCRSVAKGPTVDSDAICGDDRGDAVPVMTL